MIKKGAAAVSLAAVVGFVSVSMGAYAQNASSATGTAQTAQNSSDMVSRVKEALQAEPALTDKHIDVSMKNGKVVMKGFVDTAGDLEKAVRAANKAAGAKNVINELTIQRQNEPNT